MNSLVYSTARIKTKENSLFSRDKLLRLLDQSTLVDCLKILAENGYPVGEGDYNSAITLEINRACDYCKSIIPSGYGIELFFTEFDYHNLKSILKAKYGGLSSWEELLAPEGNVKCENISKYVFDGVDAIPKNMQAIANYFVTMSESGVITAKSIDLYCDRQCFAAIFSELKKVKGNKKYFVRYFNGKVDLANIGTFLRCKKQNLDKSIFTESFIEGGTLPLLKFIKQYENGVEAILNEFKGSEYYSILAQGIEDYNKSTFSEYEVRCENYLMNIFKKEKHDMFSAACIAGYLIGKLTEGKNIRIILTGVKNSVEKNSIKIRLRELYA